MSTSDPKDDPDATAPRPAASPTLNSGSGTWGATSEALPEVNEAQGGRHRPMTSADFEDTTSPGGTVPSGLDELVASSPQQPAAHSVTVPFPGLPFTGVATPPPAAISSRPPPLPNGRPPSTPPAIPEAALLRTTKNPTPKKPSPQPVPVTAEAKMGFPGEPQVMPSSNEPESSAIFTMKKLEEADRAAKAAAAGPTSKVDPLDLPTMPPLAQPMPMPVPLAQRNTDPFPPSIAPSDPRDGRRFAFGGAVLVLAVAVVIIAFQTAGAMNNNEAGWPGSAIARLLQRRAPPRTPAAAPPTPATARADEVAANAEHTATLNRLRAAEARLRLQTPQTALNDAAVGQPTVPPPVQVAAPPPPPTPLPATAVPPPQPVAVAATPDAGPMPAAPDTAQAPCVLLSTFPNVSAAHAAGYTGSQIDMTGTATPGIYICRPE